MADETSLVLALVVARRPRTLEGVAARRETLAKPFAIVTVGKVAEEHVAPRKIALAQRTALSVAVSRLVLLQNGWIKAVGFAASLVHNLDHHVMVEAVMTDE